MAGGEFVSGFERIGSAGERFDSALSVNGSHWEDRLCCRRWACRAQSPGPIFPGFDGSLSLALPPPPLPCWRQNPSFLLIQILPTHNPEHTQFRKSISHRLPVKIGLGESTRLCLCIIAERRLLSQPPALHHGAIPEGGGKQWAQLLIRMGSLFSWGLHSKCGVLSQCWFNVGPPSATVDQHWAGIEQTHSCFLCICQNPRLCHCLAHTYNTGPLFRTLAQNHFVIIVSQYSHVCIASTLTTRIRVYAFIRWMFRGGFI